MGQGVNVLNADERKALALKLYGAFYETYEELDNNQEFVRMADEIVGTGKGVALGYLKGLPSVSEMKKARVMNRLDPQNFSIDYKKWDATILIDKDDLMNDQIGQYDKAVRGMAENHKNFEQKRFVTALSSNGICYDGTAFFGSSHHGSQDNSLTSVAASAIAVPTVAEAQEALRSIRTEMMGFEKDMGEPAGFGMGVLDVICNPQLAAIFGQIAKNGTIANNDNELAGTIRVIPSAYLGTSSTTTTFYVLDNNKVSRPIVKFTRMKLELNSALEDSHLAITQDDFAFTSTARFETSYGDWKGAIKYVFTT